MKLSPAFVNQLSVHKAFISLGRYLVEKSRSSVLGVYFTFLDFSEHFALCCVSLQPISSVPVPQPGNGGINSSRSRVLMVESPHGFISLSVTKDTEYFFF